MLPLALGIAAHTGIFSLVNGLLFHALPVVEPEQLVTVSGGASFNQASAATWTYPIWNQIRERTDVFDGAVAWQAGEPRHVTRGGETHTVDSTYVSGAYFTTLVVPAVAGPHSEILHTVRQLLGCARCRPASCSVAACRRPTPRDPVIVIEPVDIEKLDR